MLIQKKLPQKVEIRLTSSVESVRATLEPYSQWIEEMIGAPLSETLTLEVESNPGDSIGVELLRGLAIVANTSSRAQSWHSLIEAWALPPRISPRISSSLQRERKPSATPVPVWEIDWKDCPISFQLKGLTRRVISAKMPMHFPPCEYPFRHVESQHWLIAHRDDAAKMLLLIQQVQDKTERYLETAYGRARLEAKYDWDSVLLDPTARQLVRTDFELFFEREQWFRRHNLPYRRGYLLWGSPGNGKSATIRVMAAHPFVKPYSIDLCDEEEGNKHIHEVFEQAAENTPALIILEDIDRAFPKEGKWTKERSVSFQALLNAIDGVGSQNGIIVVATANDPTCLDAALVKRPGRFDRVAHFKNPNEELRREYFRKLNPTLSGAEFEATIAATDGLSFAQLKECYVMASQVPFERGREITVADMIEAVELQAAGAHDLKSLHKGSGFVRSAHPAAKRRKAE